MKHKIEEAKEILKALGLPKGQQNDRSALTLLALCNIKANDKWSDVDPMNMSVMGNKDNARYPGIMRFIAEHYDFRYAENSRETIRRQTLHQFLQAGIILHNPENPATPTNSKDNHYCLSPEASNVIRSFGTKKWTSQLNEFEQKIGFLKEKYAKNRSMKQIPLKLKDGQIIHFSPGKHNEVQVAIINEFAPRFAPGSHLVYVGDTADKGLYKNENLMQQIGVPNLNHSKLPDVVLYDSEKDWLYLIEAVTSHGPISPKRYIELEELLINCSSGKVYVTAFPDFKEFKKHSTEIAWETEVWLVELPEHMIHFNGDRFMGPRE